MVVQVIVVRQVWAETAVVVPILLSETETGDNDGNGDRSRGEICFKFGAMERERSTRDEA